MTNPTRLFEKKDGLTILDEPYFSLAKRNAPGLMARHVAHNRGRHRDFPDRHDQEIFQDWEPLPLDGGLAEAWFPVVVKDGKGLDGRGSIPGQLVRVGLDLDPDQSVEVPKRHADAAKAWVRTIVGDKKMALPGEGRLGLRMTMDPSLITDDFSSCELACACVLISQLTQRTSRGAAVASGKLMDTKQRWGVSTIGKAHIKEEIVAAETCAAMREVQPLIVGGTIESKDVLSWMESHFGAGLQDALRNACFRSESGMIFQAVKVYDADRSQALQLATATKDNLRGTDKAVALWIIGAEFMHAGQSEQALEHIKAAEMCWDEHDVDRYPKAFLRPWLESLSGIALLDNGLVTDAVCALRRIYDGLCGAKENNHDWRTTATNVVGSLRRAMQANGQLPEAIALYKEWIVIAPQQERARCLGDLAVMFWALGDVKQAESLIADAHECLKHSTDEDRPKNRRYLELFQMRMGSELPERPPPWRVKGKDGKLRLRPIDFSEAALWNARCCASFVPFVEDYRLYCEESKTHSIAAGWIVLRGIAEHMESKGVGGQLEPEISQFIQEQKRRLDTKQAASMTDALAELEQGNPRPWLRVAPY